MKKSILLGSVASLLFGTTLHGQVTTPTNLSPAGGTPFVGWSGAGPGGPRDLDIRNNYNLPIKFLTNGNNERMRITPTGLVSVSNGLNAPLSLLHVNSNGNAIGGELFRTTGPANQTNAWRMFTGAGNGTERFSIFVPTNSNNVFLSTRSNGHLLFETNSLTRLKINNTISTPISANYSALQVPNRDGFMLLSNLPASPLITNDNIGAWSMLHLNSDNNPSTLFYRNWMRTGITFTGGSDAAYVGYRVLNNPTTQSGQDRTEMTIAWSNDISGDPNPVSVFGPDDMVFRFVGWTQDPTNANTLSSNNNATNDNDGRHIARFTPSGFLAIGPNFGWQFDDTYVAPTERLDVDGNSRLRTLPTLTYLADNNVTKVVMVDETGVLRWKNLNQINVGNYCSSPNNPLASDYEIPLNNNSYFFSDPYSPDLGENKVSVGYFCNEDPSGRLSAKWNRQVNSKSVVGFFQNLDYVLSTSTGTVEVFGLQSIANQTQSGYGFTDNIGAYFYGGNGSNTNFGLKSISKGGKRSFAGDFYAAGGINNIGVVSKASFNGNFYLPDPNGSYSIGGYFSSFNTTTSMNYGIYAIAPVNNSTVNQFPMSYAGYFKGNLHHTGIITTNSDSIFKKEIKQESKVLEKLLKLNPVNFYHKTEDYPTFGFNDNLQHGFVAQELEQFFPELVSIVSDLGEYDSLGNVINQSMEYKAVNYTGLISLNTQAIIESTNYFLKKTLSDQSIKTNVNNLDNSLDKVIAMRGVTFDWTHGAQDTLSLDSLTHVGFIAQEINTIDPLLTYMDDKALMHVDYQKVIPVAVEAIEELNNKLDEKDSIINSLNDRLTQLENCLSGILPHLCQMSQSAIETNTPITQEAVRAQLAVKLNNKDAIILDQNVPNPFAEQTVINFSIPATVVKAQIHFYSAEGKLMQSVDVKDRGLGSITVFGSDLSSGTYTYSLVADGIVVATKRMVKE